MTAILLYFLPAQTIPSLSRLVRTDIPACIETFVCTSVVLNFPIPTADLYKQQAELLSQPSRH